MSTRLWLVERRVHHEKMWSRLQTNSTLHYSQQQHNMFAIKYDVHAADIIVPVHVWYINIKGGHPAKQNKPFPNTTTLCDVSCVSCLPVKSLVRTRRTLQCMYTPVSWLTPMTSAHCESNIDPTATDGWMHTYIAIKLATYTSATAWHESAALITWLENRSFTVCECVTFKLLTP